MHRLVLSTFKSSVERLSVRHLSVSRRCFKLDEFFDDPKNFGAITVFTGRPWMKEELRRKGNDDLHKLWYVLLKERNMLMTMQEEYHRLREPMPNPERFEKVEESMENLLSVVQERDRAVGELESGTSPHPPETWRYDELGRAVRSVAEEHYVPRQRVLEGHDWSTPFLRIEREKQIEKQRRARKARAKRLEEEDRESMLFKLEEVDASSGTASTGSESSADAGLTENTKASG